MDIEPHNESSSNPASLRRWMKSWWSAWRTQGRLLLALAVALVVLAQWLAPESVLTLLLGLVVGSWLQLWLGRSAARHGPATNEVIAQDINTSQQAFAVLRQQVSATIQTSETAVFSMMERMTRVHGNTMQLRDRISEAVGRSQALSADSLSQADRHGQALEHLADHQREFETLRQGSLDRVRSVANQVRDLTPLAQLITEISRQTNLISINASIEAARAGDAGAGFKVVASEVRRLSSQTAEAAQQITQGIHTAALGVDAELHRLEEGLVHSSSVQMHEIAEHMRLLSNTLGDVVPYLAGLSSHMEVSMQQVTADIVETLGDMQFQDINRQLLEQINSALASLSKHFAQLYQLIDGRAPPPPELLEELLRRWSSDYVMHSQRVAHAHGTGGTPLGVSSQATETEPVGLELATANGPRIELF
ncbi:methyl-accepting chemotaxis protein [Curvibacter sp. HBC28]|uniref:Methyl-accepting chemotaxis protein n=1 Tax=Curvibacter microcysteis TaxID=3026419 RepID=A0ABT5MJA6_9BURK|nr:methyl-accepting chemotaxis protein [Curvibacter sp. HBC28]MDD0815972.1 methyl-accepting chemotaxis protein [Curvibacter sp. HBC28]